MGILEFDYLGNSIGRAMNNVSFEFDEIPKYVKRIDCQLSADAEINYECDIDVRVLEKIIGVDISRGSDLTGVTMSFKTPYEVQVKKHKKKRINKKWAKKYGYKTMFKSYQLEEAYFEHRAQELDIICSRCDLIF